MITATSYGRGAGSARVRVFDWVDRLGLQTRTLDYLGTSRIGLRDIAASPLRVLRAEAELRRVARTAAGSTVLVSRQASPFSNGGVESALLRLAGLGVYDVDDALFAHPPGAREAIWSKRRTWHAAIAAADRVIAGNDVLAEAAASTARSVVVIPSCVDPDEYPVKSDFEVTDQPRAVWLGSPSTEHYLTTIEEPLLALHGTRGLRLTVISAGSTSLGALDRMVDRVSWSPAAVADHLPTADVGIMPLEDSLWARGKCAYKLLQYGASALPMVGSPIGANRDVLRAAGAPAPETSGEWAGAIEQIIDASTAQRASWGAASRTVVVESFSFRRWEPEWRSALGLDTR